MCPLPPTFNNIEVLRHFSLPPHSTPKLNKPIATLYSFNISFNTLIVNSITKEFKKLHIRITSIKLWKN
jgi:hypothetical protein